MYTGPTKDVHELGRVRTGEDPKKGMVAGEETEPTTRRPGVSGEAARRERSTQYAPKSDSHEPLVSSPGRGETSRCETPGNHSNN